MGISSLILSLTLGISSNLDKIGIGLSYSFRNRRIPFLFCICASAISFLACLLGAWTGLRIGHTLSPHLCNVIGMVILVAVGLWIVIQSFASSALQSDPLAPQPIGFHEYMLIGLAQAMSDLSLGFGTGFTGLNGWITSVSVGLFSFAFLLLPTWVSPRFIPARFQKRAAVLSGMLLMAVGLLQ